MTHPLNPNPDFVEHVEGQKLWTGDRVRDELAMAYCPNPKGWQRIADALNELVALYEEKQKEGYRRSDGQWIGKPEAVAESVESAGQKEREMTEQERIYARWKAAGLKTFVSKCTEHVMGRKSLSSEWSTNQLLDVQRMIEIYVQTPSVAEHQKEGVGLKEASEHSAHVLQNAFEFLDSLSDRIENANQNECLCGSAAGEFGCPWCSAHEKLFGEIDGMAAKIENALLSSPAGNSNAISVPASPEVHCRKCGANTVAGICERCANIISPPDGNSNAVGASSSKADRDTARLEWIYRNPDALPQIRHMLWCGFLYESERDAHDAAMRMNPTKAVSSPLLETEQGETTTDLG